MPCLLLSGPGGRLALRRPLFMTLTKDTIECHPLLLNHTWDQRWEITFIFESDGFSSKAEQNNNEICLYTLTLSLLCSPSRNAGSLFSRLSSELFCYQPYSRNELIFLLELGFNKTSF